MKQVKEPGGGEPGGREKQNRQQPSWQVRGAGSGDPPGPRCKLLGANGPTGTGHLAKGLIWGHLACNDQHLDAGQHLEINSSLSWLTCLIHKTVTGLPCHHIGEGGTAQSNGWNCGSCIVTRPNHHRRGSEM